MEPSAEHCDTRGKREAKNSMGRRRVDLCAGAAILRADELRHLEPPRELGLSAGPDRGAPFYRPDGQEKIQLRVDLGLLQMNVQGRPDGKRPLGHPSLFEYQEARLKKHMDERGSDDGFALRAEDCAKL